MTAEPLILQIKYVAVVKEFAEKMSLTLDDALKFFYYSEVYQLMSEGVSDMHCMSEGYLVEDLMEEYYTFMKREVICTT